MYEPYAVIQGTPSIPLWAHISIENEDYDEDYNWQKLISLPWLPITKMRVSVAKALCAANDVPYAPLNQENVITDYEGTKEPTEVRMKPYVTQQYCHTIKFIMQLDKNEKGKRSEGLILSPNTQTELKFILQAAQNQST